MIRVYDLVTSPGLVTYDAAVAFCDAGQKSNGNFWRLCSQDELAITCAKGLLLTFIAQNVSVYLPIRATLESECAFTNTHFITRCQADTKAVWTRDVVDLKPHLVIDVCGTFTINTFLTYKFKLNMNTRC